MKYFTLITRDSDGRWSAEFGDYDRDAVADEKQDLLDHGWHRTDVAIVMTDDTQAGIDAKLYSLNNSTDEAQRALSFAHQHDWGRLAQLRHDRKGRPFITKLVDSQTLNGPYHVDGRTLPGQHHEEFAAVPATMKAVREFGGY